MSETEQEKLRAALKAARKTIREMKAHLARRPCGCRPVITTKRCRVHRQGVTSAQIRGMK